VSIDIKILFVEFRSLLSRVVTVRYHELFDMLQKLAQIYATFRNRFNLFADFEVLDDGNTQAISQSIFYIISSMIFPYLTHYKNPDRGASAPENV
jgi:hypothetical protein